MASIQNKTKRAIAVPLPGGKTLRLGPLKTGQVTLKALDHPPLKKLIEAGEIELTDETRQHDEPTNSANRPTSGRNNSGGGGIRYTGDR